MDVISVIITLVSVVAAVLQIVLFFKVWGMCNDIKAMRQVQAPERDTDKKEEDSIFSSAFALVAYIVIICVIVYLIIQWHNIEFTH